MTVSSINKSRPALDHRSSVWKYHHGGCLFDCFQVFFFNSLVCLQSTSQFFLYFSQPKCLSPIISASLASEVEEQPIYFTVTSFHLGHDILPSCHKA